MGNMALGKGVLAVVLLLWRFMLGRQQT